MSETIPHYVIPCASSRIRETVEVTITKSTPINGAYFNVNERVLVTPDEAEQLMAFGYAEKTSLP